MLSNIISNKKLPASGGQDGLNGADGLARISYEECNLHIFNRRKKM